MLSRASRPSSYAASGDIRPDDALADIVRAIRAGAVVVTPSLYALYDPQSAPAGASRSGDGRHRGGRRLALRLRHRSGLGQRHPAGPRSAGSPRPIEQVRCQEIFDYSTYDQPDSVRFLVGMGQPMDEVPPMVAPTIPTMVWGGQLRLMARALGVELDDITETVDRRALDDTVETAAMGTFEAGTQGALRFEVQGIVDGEPVIVIEHVTRIHPSVRARLAVSAGRRRRGAPGDHRGPPAHRGQRRGHRRGRQPGRRRQRHRRRPAGQRDPLAASRPIPASTTPSTSR